MFLRVPWRSSVSEPNEAAAFGAAVMDPKRVRGPEGVTAVSQGTLPRLNSFVPKRADRPSSLADVLYKCAEIIVFSALGHTFHAGREDVLVKSVLVQRHGQDSVW